MPYWLAALWKGVQMGVSEIVHTAKEAVNLLKNGVQDSWTTVKDGVVRQWKTVSNGVVQAGNKMKDTFVHAGKDFKGDMVRFGGTLKGTGGKVGHEFQKFGNTMKSVSHKIANGLKDAFTGGGRRRSPANLSTEKDFPDYCFLVRRRRKDSSFYRMTDYQQGCYAFVFPIVAYDNTEMYNRMQTLPKEKRLALYGDLTLSDINNCKNWLDIFMRFRSCCPSIKDIGFHLE